MSDYSPPALHSTVLLPQFPARGHLYMQNDLVMATFHRYRLQEWCWAFLKLYGKRNENVEHINCVKG